VGKIKFVFVKVGSDFEIFLRRVVICNMLITLLSLCIPQADQIDFG
jgi:hypothetical protein